MKTNKLFSMGLGLAMILGLATVGFARQDAGSQAAPPPSAAPSGAMQGEHAKMNAETPENDPALNLTDDQKTKIEAIRTDTKEQMKAIKKDTTLSDTDREAKTKELRKSTRAQVWAVLTPDQQKQLAADMRAARQARKAGGSSTPQ
jgi:periplasmic protein CpxP/Spy